MQKYNDVYNPYKILKVDETAPVEVIKAAYRALLKSDNLHPDLGGEADSARPVIEAYETLSDPEKKKGIDEQLNQQKMASLLKKAYSERTDTRTENRFYHNQTTNGASNSASQKEYYVICLRCKGINRLTDSQSIFYTRCGGCKQFFFSESGQPNIKEDYKKPPQKNDPGFAKYLYDRKMYIRALGDYNKLIEADPKNPQYHYMAGMCCYHMINYKQATRHLSDANSLDPSSFMANLYMGKTLLKLKNPTDAVLFFEKSVELNKNHTKTRLLLGNAYYDLGRYEKAILHLVRVVKSKPTAENALFMLGMSYFNLKKPLQARIYFKIAKRLFPNLVKIDQMIHRTNSSFFNADTAAG